MRGPFWTDAELEVFHRMVKASATEAQIAMAINKECGSNRSFRAVKALKARLYLTEKRPAYHFHPAKLDQSRAGKKTCLMCRKPFHSPDKRQVHICDTCKGSEIYRGAA